MISSLPGPLETMVIGYPICRLQGTTDVAFTVLDVLGYLDEIPVCTGYEINGEVTTEFPVTSLLEKAKPVLTKLPESHPDILLHQVP